MKLQERIIQRYRQLFPDETLRETSARTGIQITRVFRLFNGLNMKVGELEAFETAMNSKLLERPGFLQISAAVESASGVLGNDELEKLAEVITRKVTAKNFARFYLKAGAEAASIA